MFVLQKDRVDAVLLRYSLIAVTALALASCGREHNAKADTTAADSARADSATGDVTRQGAQEKTKGDAKADTASKDTTNAKQDSLESIVVKVAPGRSKKDSLALVSAVRYGNKAPGWPAKAPTPAAGAIVPQKRIIAFYGNPLSKKMGVLGELPPGQMLNKLDEIIAEWKKADPDTPIQPALHLIAVVAQGAPGKDGKYRLRMDSSLIEQVYSWAQQKNALLFLDIQAGQSTVMEEMP